MHYIINKWPTEGWDLVHSSKCILLSVCQSFLPLPLLCLCSVLFPGGAVNLNNSEYYDVGRTIYQMAIQVWLMHGMHTCICWYCVLVLCEHIYTHTNMHTYLRVHVCMYTYMHACTHTLASAHAHAYTDDATEEAK